MKLSKEAQAKMNEMQDLENKYGLVVFRAGLSHMIDTGVRNLDDKSVGVLIEQIVKKGEADKANGVISIMTPEFQCEIIRCAAELARFSIWTLLAYIKKHVVINM